MNETLEILTDKLRLDGKDFYLASGDMHYFRYFKDGWRRRLQLMRDFGLTAVQTYVPWNLHEPQEGKFNFEGNLNIGEFLSVADEIGLKVLLRPSVYMCAEWDFGGMPSWLQGKRNISLRSGSGAFWDAAEKYYTRLAEEFLPYLSTKGGPIIAVAVENEYGSFGDDEDYIKKTGDLLTELGVDVPLYTANGADAYAIKNGSRPEYWTGVNEHSLTDELVKNITEYQPSKPIFISEFWGGRGVQVGGYFARQSGKDVVGIYRSMLEKGVFVNFYMFCGGTNFGFMNGANHGAYNCGVPGMPKIYIPYCTSYDVDAPISEHGEPTEKYYLCKKVLHDYLLKNGLPFCGTNEFEYSPSRRKVKTQLIGEVCLERSADLLSQAENICDAKVTSGKPMTMDELDQDYGFILYSKVIKYTDEMKRRVKIEGLHDRAFIFANGRYIGSYMRDKKNAPAEFFVSKNGTKLEILVENMGRLNFGRQMEYDKKGICGAVVLEPVRTDGSIVDNCGHELSFENLSLTLSDISPVTFNGSVPNRPAFFTGEFSAAAGIDCFIYTNKLREGCIWINGFNIGRYHECGPQGALYIPGELLKEENTICVLELYNEKNECRVTISDTPSLDTIDKDEFYEQMKVEYDLK